MTAIAVQAEAPIAVMVVDDSAVIRGAVSRMLETSGAARVVASAANGALALTAIGRADPDVVILDIEMPGMDGLTALPKLLQASPGVRVIMASTLTQHGAQATLTALQLGAADYIPKPGAGSILGAADFQRELVEKVTALGAARRKQSGRTSRAPQPRLQAVPVQAPISLRPESAVAPAIIGIGASTGGPQALQVVMSGLPASVTLPIVITQHMPATFTRILADQLGRAARRPSSEGADGMPVEPGRIYVAPGGYHMLVAREGERRVLRITSDAPENFCRPAVDPMFRSLAASYGAAVLSLVLTGMGADGAKGAKTIAAAGGTVVAQDEATSVVWGMPGATAASGACSMILPLPEIGPRLWRLAGRGSL